MDKKTVKILVTLFILLSMTGLIFMIFTIIQFPQNMTITRDNLRSFDDDRELFSYSPNNCSGTYNLTSFVYLPQTGTFDLKLFCDSAIGMPSTPFIVSLTINANISGSVMPVNLAATSYTRFSYFQPDGVYITSPEIDQSWESSEYSANTNITFNMSWTCNFNGWELKVLYLNDTLRAQRAQLINAKIAAGLAFGLGLGVSITAFVVGIVGAIYPPLILRLKKHRKGMREQF